MAHWACFVRVRTTLTSPPQLRKAEGHAHVHAANRSHDYTPTNSRDYHVNNNKIRLSGLTQGEQGYGSKEITLVLLVWVSASFCLSLVL